MVRLGPEELAALLEKLGPMDQRRPEEIYEMKVRASKVAHDAHIEQNKLIDGYFNAVLARTYDPMILNMCREDNTPLPGLETKVQLMFDLAGASFGRRVVMVLNKNVIGDATFIVRIENGIAIQEVKEKIPRDGGPVPANSSQS